MDFGKFAVLFAERNTGILLRMNGSYYLGEGEYYQVFDTEREADDFAQDFVIVHTAVECSIHDREGKHLRLVV